MTDESKNREVSVLVAVHPDAPAPSVYTRDEYILFRNEIAEYGQQVPVTLAPDGRLWDGRMRQRALRELGGMFMSAVTMAAPAQPEAEPEGEQELATTIKVTDVVFRKDLYPRMVSDHDPALVQRYAENLNVLPPIEVNQRYELIDGKHRWLAHDKDGMIAVTITPTASDAELLELAIRRNASHGYQLSNADKQALAVKLYDLPVDAGAYVRAAKKQNLSDLLSVDLSTINRWVDRIDQTAAEMRKQQVYRMWLACCTHQEISDALNMGRATVTELLENVGIGDLPNSDKIAANHADGFEPQVYNIWTWGRKSNAVSHPGNSEQGIVDELLCRYTKPHGIVVDPFGGGGSTIDVCKKRHRRYWVGDLTPIKERAHEIRQHDIVAGLPRLGWKDVELAYLDPPYWKQLAGTYSDSPQDLSNMSLDDFHNALAGVIRGLAGRMPNGSHIALLISPTRMAPDYRLHNHTAEMHKRIKLLLDDSVSCPYSTQQYNGTQVNWAKENLKTLPLTRELTVWEVVK